MASTRGSGHILTRRASRIDYGSQDGLYRPEFHIKSEVQEQTNDKLWEIMSTYIPNDKKTIQKTIVNHVEYTLAKTRFNFGQFSCYQAAALSLRDRLIEAWNDTNETFFQQDIKRVYYFSLEYLLGRAFQNAIMNLQIEQNYKEALLELGYKLEELYEQEHDPGLGNGGLGRLAACFLDSLATLEYPAWGYGIRYDYGIFQQKIKEGYQIEVPDFWLNYGNCWEIERIDVVYPVRFYGHVCRIWEKNGQEKVIWDGGETVLAVAYDHPIPGFNTFNTINLRLWRSRPTNEFVFDCFNKGDYFGAVAQRQRAEYITSLLYPNDQSYEGKELRMKQQYFFVCASLQDILRRFKKKTRDWEELPQKVAIQLNDTHPALAIVELLRILIDEEGLEIKYAWTLIYKVFSYTNHTVLPEALEKWSTDLIGRLLPRHLELIYIINYYFLQKVQDKYPGDLQKLRILSLVEEGIPKQIRMANLSIIGSHTVNGVAQLHSKLLKTNIFKDFYEMFPYKFQNKTNGVTPRRWIMASNPGLADLYSQHFNTVDWVCDLEVIKELSLFAEDLEFQQVWYNIKLQNKLRLIKWIESNVPNVQINPFALFDVMVKRMHEYKRQFMNALYLIHRYLTIKNSTQSQRLNMVPRAVFIGGKAAPGYVNAKRIIKLINCISDVVNNDKEINDLLKVVFLPNYNVSNAQVIIPAAELSQHISTAGTEASGTSNMKFCMNGCLILGTMDGANVEILEEIQEDNMFIFGARLHEVQELRLQMIKTEPKQYWGKELDKVFSVIRDGMFGNTEELGLLLDTICNRNDQYLVCHDFYSYLDAQNKVDQAYKDQTKWQAMSIRCATNVGKFSSDRTIHEYVNDIWKLDQIKIPKPALTALTRFRSYANIVMPEDYQKQKYYDKDVKGYLTQREFKNAIYYQFGIKIEKTVLKQLIVWYQNLENNQDLQYIQEYNLQKFSLKFYMEVCKDFSKKYSVQSIQDQFNVISNQENVISVDDIKLMFDNPAFSFLSEVAKSNIISILDRDKDGIITLKNFKDVMEYTE